MAKLTWRQRAAKRLVAEAALRQAVTEMEKAREVGGSRTGPASADYQIAGHLAQHAAEQLRMSEGD